MKFMATLKGLRMTGKGATITFDIPIDDIGDLDGIQILMGDWVKVQVDPYQMSLDDVVVVSNGN